MVTAKADDVTSKATNKGGVGHDVRLDKRIGGRDGHVKQKTERCKNEEVTASSRQFPPWLPLPLFAR